MEMPSKVMGREDACWSGPSITEGKGEWEGGLTKHSSTRLDSRRPLRSARGWDSIHPAPLTAPLSCPMLLRTLLPRRAEINGARRTHSPSACHITHRFLEAHRDHLGPVGAPGSVMDQLFRSASSPQGLVINRSGWGPQSSCMKARASPTCEPVRLTPSWELLVDAHHQGCWEMAGPLWEGWPPLEVWHRDEPSETCQKNFFFSFSGRYSHSMCKNA